MPPPLIRISSLSCSPPNSSPNRPTSLPLPLPLILIKKNHLRPLSSLPLLSRPLRRCRNRRLATRSSVSFLKTSAAPGLPRASSRGCSSSCPAVTSGISSRLRRKKNRSVSMSALTNERSLPIMAGLGRMWMLVAKDRWIITIAFASLFFASVILMMQLSDISIPHFLAASIFSAQSGESITFYRNAKILVLLCFFIRNMRWLARLLLWYCKYDTDEVDERERLYQDMSFLDEETVGGLTSRLGADCQQVSQVIGYDLNLICCNVLQGTGAIIYLFILSSPLTLSTLVICSVLATIMLIYGQYTKTES